MLYINVWAIGNKGLENLLVAINQHIAEAFNLVLAIYVLIAARLYFINGGLNFFVVGFAHYFADQLQMTAARFAVRHLARFMNGIKQFFFGGNHGELLIVKVDK